MQKNNVSLKSAKKAASCSQQSAPATGHEITIPEEILVANQQHMHEMQKRLWHVESCYF